MWYNISNNKMIILGRSVIINMTYKGSKLHLPSPYKIKVDKMYKIWYNSSNKMKEKIK